MAKPTLHLIGLFHTIPSAKYSHCAFTGKVLRWSKMMNLRGYKTVEYSNGESESACERKMQILGEAELAALIGERRETDFHGNTAVIGSSHWQEFDKRLRPALRDRLAQGDIILHPFGRSHYALKSDFPEQSHVESGIGYPDGPFGAYRIFESKVWQAWHQGKHGTQGSDYEWTVPNYFDLDEWTPHYDPGQYSLFFGRIYSGKGMDIIKALAEAGEKIMVAGQGDFAPYQHPNLTYLGPVVGRSRDALLGNAKCMLMPTRFIEPFGGSGVEAMLCGTPLISSDFGAFSETVEHGKTGYRCHTLADWVEAIRLAPTLDRRYISERARRLYSLETCGAQYDRIFTQISDLWGEGWYHKRPIFVP